jgi:hypothetical protein
MGLFGVGRWEMRLFGIDVMCCVFKSIKFLNESYRPFRRPVILV